MSTAVDRAPLRGCTTVLLWGPVADRWRGREGGTSTWVIDAALRALGSGDVLRPIPAPSAAAVDALARAGTALNTAVRERYVRGGGAGAIEPAARAVAAAAAELVAGQPAGGDAVLCVGRRDRLVHLRMDPRQHEVFAAAATAAGMTIGAWVREAVAAALGEHAARRPAPATRDARAAAGRVAGLLAQAAIIATDDGEAAAVAAADDALGAAVDRMSRWGARR